MPEIRRTLSDQRIDIISAAGGITEMKGEYQRSLRILFGVCALVLLIACTNIANLLLAREITRRRQTALRIAVGASRKRILRLSLVESMILALLGSAAGLFVADGAVRLIVNLAFHSAEFLSSYTASVRPILLFSLAMACLTTVVFGAAPAWLASHTDPVQALRGAGRATRDEFSLPRQAFLVLQAAFSVLLVVVAGLLTHSLSNLQHQQFGFDTANGVHVQLEAAPAPYNFERLARLANEIEDRVNRLPGVESAGLITYGPLNGLSLTEHVFVEGSSTSTLIGSAWKTESSWARVTPRYLPAVGHTLLRGRNFTNADNTSAELVAVVNQSFVNQYLAGEEPLGKRFGIFKPVYAKTFRIIGVVRDAKYEVANLPARPMFFLPAAQQATFSNEFNWPEHFSHRIGGLALKTKLPPSELEPVLKKAISAVDPDVTIVSIRTMKEHVDRALSQQHAVASLARLFSIVALILAGVGLYGVASYTVSQRTNEIGVRMVLGANRQEIIRLVMHGAFKNVVIGLLLGIPLALAAGKLISAQLYGVSMWDPLALSVAIVALGFCAFVAVIIPAVRAASTEPVEALRVEY
jgi:predicted permease